MSRFHLSLALLTGASLLGGCVAVPCGNGNVCYQPLPPQPVAVAPYPGYAPPPPGYAPPPPDAAYFDPNAVPAEGTYVGADGLTYVDGAPYAVIDGVQEAILFDAALGWGWYDGYHHWHGAPRDYADRWNRYHPGGRGFPVGRGGGRYGGEAGRPGYAGPRGEARPVGGFRGGPGAPPQAYRGQAALPAGARQAVPQGFSRGAPAPAASRPAAPSRRCEPGQRC